MSYTAHLSNKKNLLAGKNWENNPNNPYDTKFIASVEGETYLQDVSSPAGCGILITGMENGKIYQASWNYANLDGATVYPYARTSSANTAADGQILILNNDIPINTATTLQEMSICHNLSSYPWFKMGNGSTSGGQNIRIDRPKLIEDKNWTENIFNGHCDAYNFVALGQASRNWRSMTTLGSDVYVCVQNGDVYKQTGGMGDFVALSQTSRGWTGMTSNGTDVYACVYGGDIYKQTGGTGNFVALGQASRTWRGMTTLGTDVYACVYGGDIYKQRFTLKNNLRTHFRADCCTINSATNQTVPTIYNTMGTQATQSTATKQPLHVSNKLMNGDNRDYLTFDGVDDTTVHTEDMSNNAFDWWVVAKDLPTTSTIKGILSKGTGSSDLTDICIDFTSGLRGFYFDSNSNPVQCGAGAPPSAGINLIRYTFNSVGGSKLYLNGVLSASNATTTPPKNSSDNHYLGSRCNVFNAFLSCKLYEYLSFQVPLTESEASRVMEYLRRRYGNEANF